MLLGLRKFPQRLIGLRKEPVSKTLRIKKIALIAA
jgi:hypothetical protein